MAAQCESLFNRKMKAKKTHNSHINIVQDSFSFHKILEFQSPFRKSLNQLLLAMFARIRLYCSTYSYLKKNGNHIKQIWRVWQSRFLDQMVCIDAFNNRNDATCCITLYVVASLSLSLNNLARHLWSYSSLYKDQIFNCSTWPIKETPTYIKEIQVYIETLDKRNIRHA